MNLLKLAKNYDQNKIKIKTPHVMPSDIELALAWLQDKVSNAAVGEAYRIKSKSAFREFQHAKPILLNAIKEAARKKLITIK